VGDEVPLPVVLEGPCGRVERLEEAVVDRDLGVRERVQQGRLADVRVAGQRDDGRLAAPPFLAACLTLAGGLPPAGPGPGDAGGGRGGGGGGAAGGGGGRACDRSRAATRPGRACRPRLRARRYRRRGARG